MRLQPLDEPLIALLRQCYRTPSCRKAPQALSLRPCRPVRAFSTTLPKTSPAPVDPTAPDIAILGGGITGSIAALHLSFWLPKANITLYESKDRLGGWLESKHVKVAGGEVIFEQGPRTIRPLSPAGIWTLDVVRWMGLEHEMIITPKTADAARNRYIYYPDRLVKMPNDIPSMVQGLLNEPIFKGAIKGALSELLRRDNNYRDDESIGDFLRRRMGNSDVADNIVSAVLHGIYAGDIYQLSMMSLMPEIWNLEREDGSFIIGMLAKKIDEVLGIVNPKAKYNASILENVHKMERWSELEEASVYTFKRGIAQLAETMERYLRLQKNVTIKTDTKVKNLELDVSKRVVKVHTATNQPPRAFNRVLSTLPAPVLSSISPSPLPSLAAIPSTTVLVVNLYFASPTALPISGFGYLIPRSVPADLNPECALGVIFDSCSSTGQDTAPGTKLTVMLGGHWWKDWSDADYPSPDEAVEMARNVVARHLGISDVPEASHVTLQKNCIPQYTVGHHNRLAYGREEIESAFGVPSVGSLVTVAGNWIDGVGLNDCVVSGRAGAWEVKRGLEEGRGSTGLEKWLPRRKLTREEARAQGERKDGGV